MAKIRRETTRMKPEVHTRESKIAALVAVGLGNASIWSALQQEYPETIENGDPRRDPHSLLYIDGIPPFNKDERDRLSRAINSVRGLEIKADEEMRDAVEMVGGDRVRVQSPDDIELTNRRRFTFGVSAMDFIYGETKFKHLTDSSDSIYEEVDRIYRERDHDGKIQEITRKVNLWVGGSWRQGDPMIPSSVGYLRTRDSDGNLIKDIPMNRQIIERGCPEGLMSVWGGAYGVGKSRLAVLISKSINAALHEPTLYINGEANAEDMRSWLGHDVDDRLFRLVNSELLPVERIAEFAYEVKPRVIIIDSIQTIAEIQKGERAVKTALSRLKMLKSDPRAGMPHIILVSQLNAAGKVKGGTTIPHIVDVVAHVKKMDGRKGHFIFEIPNKNRGGETPRGATFKHTDTTVECVSISQLKTPLYQLAQPVENEVVNRGVLERPAEISVTVSS